MQVLTTGRRILTSVAFGTLLSLGTTHSFAQEKLTISLETGPLHLQTRTIGHFASELEKRSGGALEVEVFDSAQLYNSRDVGKAVARGDVAMSVLTTPSLSRIEPNLNIFDLPLLNGLSTERRNEIVDGPLGQRLSELVGERMGVVVPGNWFLLGSVLYWSTGKPLTNFDEFAGLQVRIPGGAANAARLEVLGATAVVMPFADTPLALQQGVVDATMGSKETIVAQKLVDTGIRYGFWDQGIVGYLMPIVSQKYWNSLNEEQRTLFRDVWNEAVEMERKGVQEGDAEHQKTLEAQGVSFAEASDEEVAAVQGKLMAIQPALVEKLGIAPEIMALAEAELQ